MVIFAGHDPKGCSAIPDQRVSGALFTFAHCPNFKYRVAVGWFSEPDAP
jgi:hypothetical protein